MNGIADEQCVSQNTEMQKNKTKTTKHKIPKPVNVDLLFKHFRDEIKDFLKYLTEEFY